MPKEIFKKILFDLLPIFFYRQLIIGELFFLKSYIGQPLLYLC
jgi:hypothetical protein